MRNLKSWLVRQIIYCLAVSLVVPLGLAETNQGLAASDTAGNNNSTVTRVVGQSGVGTATKADVAPVTTSPESPEAPLPPVASQAPQNSTPQPAQNKQDTQSTAPVGTAAAPYQKQEGISASKPGGAAIAPGKQRRIRSFAIRVGLLVGAGIAIGVVTAATLSSPSRP